MTRSILTALMLTTAARAANVKLVDVDGYLLVQTRVNGKGPYLFLLDTGATSSSLTPEVARAAGLVPRGRTRMITVSGETIVSTAQAQITVGDAVAESEVLIDSLEAVRSVDARIAGVIGQSFLTHFPCFIDYRHHLLLLGEEAARRGESLARKFVAKRADGRILIPAAVGGSQLRLALDSGAPALVLTCGTRCARLDSPSVGDLSTNTGHRPTREGTVGWLSVNGVRIERPRTVMLDASPLDGEDGLLPARWFSSVYLGQGNVVGLAR